MLSRIINVVTSRVQISSAWLYANAMTGGIAGSLFTFGNVFKIPLNFCQGWFPAALTFFGRIFFFIRKLTQQYAESNLDNPSIKLKEKEVLLSTDLIINLLKENPEASKSFLQNFHITESEINRLNYWTKTSDDHLQDVLNKLFNEMQYGLEKYSMSTLLAVFTVTTHFMEVMLLELYHKPDLFSFEQGFNYANIALCMMGFCALLHGIIEFDNTKLSYEHPTPSVLCDSIFKSYKNYKDKFIPSDHDENLEVVLNMK